MTILLYYLFYIGPYVTIGPPGPFSLNPPLAAGQTDLGLLKCSIRTLSYTICKPSPA